MCVFLLSRQICCLPCVAFVFLLGKRAIRVRCSFHDNFSLINFVQCACIPTKNTFRGKWCSARAQRGEFRTQLSWRMKSARERSHESHICNFDCISPSLFPWHCFDEHSHAFGVSFPASARRAQVQQIGNKIVPNESYVIPWANVQLIEWFYVSVLNCKLRFATDIAKNSIPFQLSIVLQILIVNSRNCRMNSRWRLSVHTYRVAAQRSRILLWIVLLKQSLCDAQQWTVLFVSDLESQRDSVDYTAPVNRNMNASAADECANVRRNTHTARDRSRYNTNLQHITS